MSEETNETNEYFERSDLDFLRDVLVDALESKRDDLIPRLFKLYEEVRSPAPTIPPGNIDISTVSSPDGTEYNFSLTSDYLGEAGAAASVDLSSVGKDVIPLGITSHEKLSYH